MMVAIRDATHRENMLFASGVIMLVGGDTGRRTVEAYLKAAFVAEMIVGPVKYATNRQRPAGIHSRWNSSFPSSHAAMSFAVATTIADAHPRFSIPAYALASLVAYSRVYHNRHHVTDVVTGAAIGIAAAEISQKYLSPIHFRMGSLPRPTGLFTDRDESESSRLSLYVSTPF